MDHYQTMGVGRDANEEQIKKAYRQLAKQYHPDRNPGDKDAENMFKKVQEAYDILSDPDKKRLYDMQNVAPRSSPQTAPKKTKTKEDFEKEKAEKKRKDRAAAGVPGAFTQADLDAIQCTFFGGGDRGRNIMIQMKLSPSEMRNGGHKMIKIKRRNMCPTCVGDGYAPKMCPVCKGNRPEVAWCIKCESMGAIQDKCPTCNGEGVKPWTIAEVRVSWSPNVQPGHQVNIIGEGEMAPMKPPGNLRVVIV
jgi:molecular chaperone DnaJ